MVMDIKRHNLHIHSTMTDGSLEPEDIVMIADENNMDIIGICDHAFSKKLSQERQVSYRLEYYINNLDRINSYSKKVKLIKGIEIDVSRDYGTDPARLPYNKLNDLDYILFEYVNSGMEWWGHVDGRDIYEIIKIRDKIKVPLGLAHNDIQKNFDGREEEIARLLGENDIFLELNQSEGKRNLRDGKNYFEHFSYKLIENLAEYSVKVVVGTDMHEYKKSIYSIDAALDFIKSNDLSVHDLVK